VPYHNPNDIETLQKEHHFISAVLEMAGALVIVLDRNGRIVQFNRACEEISGYTCDEVRGKYISDLFPVPEEMIPVKAIAAGRFPDLHESYWIAKDGNVCLIAWSNTALSDGEGNAEYAIWVGLDITERKKMEEELRAGEERYRALIENVKEGVALIQDETLMFANEAFSGLFGYDSSAEIIGKNIISLVGQHFEPRFTEYLNTALGKRSWGLSFRGRCLTKTGREFWAEKLSSVISYKGKPAILLTVRDITENMLWEQTIKQEAEYFRSENVKLKSSIGERYRLGDMIGKSPAMQKVYELILKAASTDANVIIFGKSGTGKELAARAIHDMSDRSDKAFIAVNCGAIPENLIESEFFGHRKGAFTGAYTDKHGYFHSADQGTLFLDEVSDIGLNMQVKLLRAIEGGNYTPVGDTRPRKAYVRIITAMNKDPLEMVNKGLMREDFFYRIGVIPITLPDLKDRREDIPLLAEHFLRLYQNDVKIQPICQKMMDRLLNYDWPGNVRELQNVLQRFLTVNSLDFMNIFYDSPPSAAVPDGVSEHLNLKEALEKFEKKVILHTLETVRWNKTKAASVLDISRRSLFRRMKKLGL